MAGTATLTRKCRLGDEIKIFGAFKFKLQFTEEYGKKIYTSKNQLFFCYSAVF